MKRVNVIPVSEHEKADFWKHFQNYLAEYATIAGLTPASDHPSYPWFDLYWTETDRRWPFWAKVEAEVCGLALIRRDDDGKTEMAEFYIHPQFRRRGLGIMFARKLFVRFSGHWKLGQLKSNKAAISFWRRVLDGYVQYAEMQSGHDGERIEQHFVIP